MLPAPTIVSISPTSGPVERGTSITVTGTDFTDVEGVSFGSVPAAGYSVTSEGQLTAVAPAGKSAKVVKQKPKAGAPRAPRSKVNVVLARR